MEYLVTIIAIAISLILIGFLSGIEIAFVSANKLSIELRKKQGSYSGRAWAGYYDKPAQFIGTTLVAINVIIVIYGLLSSELLKTSLFNWLSIKNPYIRLFFETIITTLLLLFIEFVFKALFKARSSNVLNSGPVTFIINIFYTLFAGAARVFVNAAEWILLYLFNVKSNKTKEAFNKADLEYFMQQRKNEEHDDTTELNQELFENALSLGEKRIRECLIPRKEIEALRHDADIETLRARFIQTKLSKLIIFENNIDNIIGYVHQLDLFKKPATIKEIILPIVTVPESMSATDLMAEFTKARKSIAWVVDEFGGTAGIVTMEDVLEEIFGEIHDEYDTDEFVEKQLSTTEFIFSGRLELDFISEKYHLEFAGIDEAETLSGFIINNNEEIPKQKDRIIIGNYQFDILSVSETRIETVKVKKLK